jgi:hypothetical protein
MIPAFQRVVPGEHAGAGGVGHRKALLVIGEGLLERLSRYADPGDQIAIPGKSGSVAVSRQPATAPARIASKTTCSSAVAIVDSAGPQRCGPLCTQLLGAQLKRGPAPAFYVRNPALMMLTN